MTGPKKTRFTEPDNLRTLLERSHSGAFFFVTPYVGYINAACEARMEKHVLGWHAPALIVPVRGRSLEADLLPPGCGSYPVLPGMSQAEYTTVMRNYAGLTSDALFYLGPRSSLVWDAMKPDIYLDLDFRAELARRRLIRTGKPLDGFTFADNPSVPQQYFKN